MVRHVWASAYSKLTHLNTIYAYAIHSLLFQSLDSLSTLAEAQTLFWSHCVKVWPLPFLCKRNWTGLHKRTAVSSWVWHFTRKRIRELNLGDGVNISFQLIGWSDVTSNRGESCSFCVKGLRLNWILDCGNFPGALLALNWRAVKIRRHVKQVID